MAYAGKGRFVAEPVDLHSLIQELAPLIQPAIPRKVKLSLDLQGDLPPVEEIPFPVLVKARRGFAARHIYRAHDADELALEPSFHR